MTAKELIKDVNLIKGCEFDEIEIEGTQYEIISLYSIEDAQAVTSFLVAAGYDLFVEVIDTDGRDIYLTIN